jgi:hypothetical protein
MYAFHASEPDSRSQSKIVSGRIIDIVGFVLVAKN